MEKSILEAGFLACATKYMTNGGTVDRAKLLVDQATAKLHMAQTAYEIKSKAIKTADEMLSIVNNIKR